MGCNISLFALQVLLNILLGNSKFLCTHMTVTLPADASHLRRERHTRNLLVDYVKGLLSQFSVDTPETSTSFSNSVQSTCAANSVCVCVCKFYPPPVASAFLSMSCVHLRVSKYDLVMPMMFDNNEMFNGATARGQVLDTTSTQSCTHEGPIDAHVHAES